ncbi:MAG: hypothetical protein LH479_04855 [Polaromonas sp.]|nr:hypothetical protein [Polaromonas sp.]
MSEFFARLYSGFLIWIGYRDSLVVSVENVALKADGVTVVAEFSLGKGSWILIAKATLKANSPSSNTTQLRLVATQGQASKDDLALATVSQLGYATLSLLLGTHVQSSADIRLEASTQGQDRSVDLKHVAITAIKTDKLVLDPP